jgi:hypothetical protein
MSEFSTKAMLDVQVNEPSLKSARSTIEDRVGSVRTQVATDGGQRSTSVGGNRLSRENAMSRQLLTEQIEQLSDIHDEIEKLGSSGLGGGSGGSGGSGGFLQGLGAASVTKKGSGVLGMLGGLLKSKMPSARQAGRLSKRLGGKGGIMALATSSRGMIRPGSGEDVNPGGINKLVGGLLPGVSGKDLTLRDEMAQSMQKDRQQQAGLTKPDWLKNPFKNWSLPESLSGLDWKNPLRDWSVPDALSLDWSNPMDDWQIPKSLSNGLNWSNPMDEWSPPDWFSQLFGSSNSKTGQPPSKGGKPQNQLAEDLGVPKENRAKTKRNNVRVDVGSPQINVDPVKIAKEVGEAVGDVVEKEVEDRWRSFEKGVDNRF